MTSPVAENIEPWQGQSQVRSALFQVTGQPLWVHAADKACGCPSADFQTAMTVGLAGGNEPGKGRYINPMIAFNAELHGLRGYEQEGK